MEGFTSRNVEVWDVRDDGVVERITGVRAFSVGPGMPVSLSFAVPPSPVAHMIIVTDPAGLGSVAVEHDVPSDLRSLTGGRHVTIGPAEFLPAIQPLVDRRRTVDGMTTQVVDVQDVYDEFSWGNVDSSAIRDFMALAYSTWSVAERPEYLMLLGDTTEDFRDYLGNGDVTYVPHREYIRRATGTPHAMLLATDAYFGLLAGGDSVPEVLVGRVSAQSAAEIDRYVQKAIDAETTPGAPWKRRHLTAVDDDLYQTGDCAGEASFVNEAEQTVLDLNCCYLNGVPPVDNVVMLVDEYGHPAARDTFVAEHNVGLANVLYLGHGAITKVGDMCGRPGEFFLDEVDTGDLRNGPMTPLFTSVSCNVGKFPWVDANLGFDRSLGETLLVQTTDAYVGFIASTQTTSLVEGLGQLEGIMDGLYAPGSRYLPPWMDPAEAQKRAGGVLFAGQMGFLWNPLLPLNDPRADDSARTLALLGDPAARLQIVDPPPPDKASCERVGFVCP